MSPDQRSARNPRKNSAGTGPRNRPGSCCRLRDRRGSAPERVSVPRRYPRHVPAPDARRMSRVPSAQEDSVRNWSAPRWPDFGSARRPGCRSAAAPAPEAPPHETAACRKQVAGHAPSRTSERGWPARRDNSDSGFVGQFHGLVLIQMHQFRQTFAAPVSPALDRAHGHAAHVCGFFV